MKIADAVAALGYADDPDLGHLLLAIPLVNGRWEHLRLADLADSGYGQYHAETYAHLYLASGYFKRGTNRTAENLGGIFTLPFDADLKDFLGLPAATVYAMAQDEIDDAITLLFDQVKAAFDSIGVVWDRIDYTGHGLCVHVRIAREDRHLVDDIRAMHKRLVLLLNDAAGFALFDKQVSDAGTRIFRLVPGLNGKSDPPRRTRVIVSTGYDTRVDDLPWAAGRTQRPLPARFDKTVAIEDLMGVARTLTPHWQDGSRHLPALGIVGMFAKAGVRELDAYTLLTNLGDDPDPRDREKVVRTTYDHVAAGRPVAGYTTLKNVLPPEALASIDSVLAKYRNANTVHVYTGTAPVGGEPVEARATPPSDGMAPMPRTGAFGWFARYADFMAPYSEAPWHYHVACAMNVAGQIAGRNVHMEWFTNRLYANQYTLLVGRSGSARKDWSIMKALEIATRSSAARMISPPFYVLTDVASAEALFDQLQAHPSSLYYMTEFTDLITKQDRKGTGNIFDRLIQVWDNPSELQSNRRDNAETVEAPTLSILAGTQPGRLANAMASEAIQSGFANRWIVVPGKADKSLAIAPRMDWDGFLSLAWELRDALNVFTGKGAELVRTKAADDWYEAWYDKLGQEERTEEEDDMRQRHAVNAMKWAMVNAMSDESALVEVRHVEAAFTAIDALWANVKVLMRTWGGNVENKIERRIRAVLAGEGPMHRAALRDKVRAPDWGATEFKRTFDLMLAEGSILLDASGTVALRFAHGGW